MRILFLHLFNRRTSCCTDIFLLKNLQSQKLISLSGPNPSRRRMQNPLEAPTYRVGNECYRRNVPWEEVKTANPAAAAEYSGEEADTDEANDVQQTMEFSAAEFYEADEMADALPNKSELQDGSEQIGSIDFMAASTSKTTAKSSVQKVELKVQGKEIKVSKNKSKAAVQVEQKEAKVELVAEKKIELIGSVKYDPKQESYNDSLRMPSALIGFLRGREGHKQKKLESKFRCNIHFPKKRSNKVETEIKIASTESANSVLNCRQEIEQLLVQARKQAMPTHFVSIPIFDPRLREQYQTLVKRIMEDEETPEECKNVKLFLPTAKLHLTICVLKLFTDEELDRAKRHLDELFRTDKIREILANNATIRLQFTALEHFADRSPDKVAVLFARAESERMQKLANVVDDALAETGLSERRKTENVVLHMTVMNTKYLWEKKRVFLNVGPVLAKFGQLNFDQVEVQQLHLCEMRGNNDDELNGYRSVHTVDFDAHFKG